MVNKTLRAGIISFIGAFILASIPLPHWLAEFRPDWVMLVVIYWAIVTPSKIGVTAAWCAGLLLDVSSGTLIGQHAIGMVLVTYVIHMQHQRLRVASLVQQALVIFILLLIKQLLILWVDGIIGRTPDSWLYFMPVFTSTLLWPWFYLVLKDLRRWLSTTTPHLYHDK